MNFTLVIGSILLLTTLRGVPANDPRTYTVHDSVEVIANTIRPYANPQETYHYHKLPFCKPEKPVWDDHDLGELLTGSRKVVTDYNIFFGDDQDYAVLCQPKLTAEEIQEFRDAIDEKYVFEFYLDDLRLASTIGRAEQISATEKNYYLYVHVHFDIGYNGPISHTSGKTFSAQIVGANITMAFEGTGRSRSEYEYLLSKDSIRGPVFSYSVKWVHMPAMKWEDRLAKNALLPDDFEIHWLSIVNSFILVMVMTLTLTIVLFRILKKDVSRYMDLETNQSLVSDDESGWKLVHADVFRPPGGLSVFTALIGAGAQLFLMVLGVLALSLGSVFNPTRRGGVVTAILILYAMTSCVGGFVSAKLYRQLKGTKWVWNIILCTCVVPGPLLAVFSVVNTVAIWNDSSAALPFGTIMIILALFVLVAFPLTVVGGIAGRNMAGDFNAPCRTTRIQREIPTLRSYKHPLLQIAVAGFLPFSAAYIELRNIFSAVWGHQIYTLFGILAIAFLMMVVVASFVTITVTYLQLTSEDHKWWWRSWTSGGASGIFMFMYSIWYYNMVTDMTGFFQAAFFFGYMGMISWIFFVMLGSIGFLSSLIFVKKIYHTIKVE